MKINCISCGHGVSLDDAYDDFRGLVKCYVCGSMLQIEARKGKLHSVELVSGAHQAPPPQQQEPRVEMRAPELLS